MKKGRKCIFSEDGFTLIEIVVSLILLSIAGALLIQLIGFAIGQSSTPIAAMKEGLALAEIMEKITADYKWILLTDTTPLETFKARVENGNTPSNTPYFGTYNMSARYINFSLNGAGFYEASSACTTDCRTLKITINRGDQHLTALFTQ